MAELDRATRECLLQIAEEIVGSCRHGEYGDKVLKMSSLVLFELKRRRDLAWMNRVLDAEHASSMSAPHWNIFRNKIKAYMSQLNNLFPNAEQTNAEQRIAAWIYLLGWLHRLANQAKSPGRQQSPRHGLYR